MICASIMAALRGSLLLAFVKINDKINIWTKTNIKASAGSLFCWKNGPQIKILIPGNIGFANFLKGIIF